MILFDFSREARFNLQRMNDEHPIFREIAWVNHCFFVYLWAVTRRLYNL